MTAPKVFDDHVCSLGEGPLWHPLRQQLFWFDINNYQMHSRKGDARQMWQFNDFVSAAGWVDQDRLIIAKKGGLIEFNLTSGQETLICELEPDNKITRPNDGRADPQGGFWIGTMGQGLEKNAGALYRYYKGELRQIFAPWTIPNAQSFSPDGHFAYLTDTPLGKIYRVRLDQDGWPAPQLDVFLDLSGDDFCPDGAVVDQRGHIWIAHYGKGKITEFDPQGQAGGVVACGARQPTCPAFGGPDLTTLYITSAAQEIASPSAEDGKVLSLELGIKGQTEHRVLL